MVVARATSPLPPSVEVQAWIDPVVERHGFGPRSSYVEFCWLPVLGPTATWIYRRLGQVVLSVDGASVDVVELADSLGLGAGLGQNGKLAQAIGRLEHFGVVRWQDNRLLVRRALGSVPASQLARLGASVRASHQRLTTPQPT